MVWHLVLGQVGGGKLGAIDAGGVAVVIVGKLEVDLLDGLDETVLDLVGLGNRGKMHHCEVLLLLYELSANEQRTGEVVNEEAGKAELAARVNRRTFYTQQLLLKNVLSVSRSRKNRKGNVPDESQIPSIAFGNREL
jgi:hypothetical protein